MGSVRPRTVARPLPAITILPLRLFLGLTFIYAGLQKLADPGFLQPGRPTYIGNQLLGFSRGSPIRSVLLHLVEHAVAIGLLTVVTEIGVGSFILLGLLTRPAATVGLLLSFTFFLSASWHTYPFFYGSDIVFVMTWLTLVLTGPGPFALDAVVQPYLWKAVEGRTGRATSHVTRSLLMGSSHQVSVGDDDEVLPAAEPAQPLLSRAEALFGAVAAVALVALGLAPRGGTSGQGGGALAGASPPPTPAGASPTAAPNATTPTGGQSVLPGGTKIGNISQVPVNSAGTVRDPKTGDPVVVVHTAGSQFYAFDAVCTHAGCTVQYDSQQRLLVCPCHGGTFDPAHGAQVVGGPPPSPLTAIQMKIDPQGNIYIV